MSPPLNRIHSVILEAPEQGQQEKPFNVCMFSGRNELGITPVAWKLKTRLDAYKEV